MVLCFQRSTFFEFKFTKIIRNKTLYYLHNIINPLNVFTHTYTDTRIPINLLDFFFQLADFLYEVC